MNTLDSTRLHFAPTARHPALRATLGAGLVALLTLAACASTPPPTGPMAVANAAITHAVGAGGVEYAPTEMAMAREKMSRANVAMANKDHDAALVLAQQAQLDAQLAEAKAEAVKARKSAVALDEADRVLGEEMKRKAQ